MTVDGWRNVAAAVKSIGAATRCRQGFSGLESFSRRKQESNRSEATAKGENFTPIPVLHWQAGPTTVGWRSIPEAQSHPKFVLECKSGRGLGQNLNFSAN